MDGILPLWKESGLTSHDCIVQLRKILKTKKIGHTGTLDPGVEGVLPICIGQATKISEYLMDAGKTYEAYVSIGRSTTTEDAEGETVEEDATYKRITRDQLLKVLSKLTGEIEQIPPMYSAVKVKGVKLYEYARKGIEIERPSRKVTIYKLELLDERELFEGQEIKFKIRVKCSKGTYIRTLAVKIGELLGYPSHMASLVRTASGNFTKQDCVTLREVEKAAEEGRVRQLLLPIEKALSAYPFIEMDASMEKKICNGQILKLHSLLKKNDKIVFCRNGKAIAVYTKHPEKPGLMKPEKMFPNNF
ncbi:tRNA pseudouridine(55) synthase TruB [Ureibacillus sp. FSL K6-8385]|uniref:tRNA pseudouridine synthase B n=1 Tax=Ureibacillus terrenus TaxID=118246 RepID=A0A540V4J0_9BACL|nr:tRNA pseudouridine(55) synthase TruB [Ureibacillus terrenus]MED3660444.1 tRNA pseudouridine(55) synthase TruB [Ureibacillus terrenus]MED3762599.1 tRNA pseudouridine(55) synthase TruB [Ureibacillus terrenus]TQE91662.1 tRNA pseudouridine(55) synthase TruB [Ureibacillus terrenus]